ncbi:hypothetical protein B0T26DRAFT_729782 [Lasiosphaeria miniovina]|uniref:Polyketide cyclase/dehydrase n=1 Tax=Lasiosphaeria miniovina TaxID=1954250 RepID=A0AA40DGX5_9PEZI|nr:uncharacterized protein B0T26DRAFT_729782 [Lasiosphaeria miniovina]KAK0703084.1 hypothetical protein B0T26DRAFT_729782 [Lasiosphaeria miniovina]
MVQTLTTQIEIAAPPEVVRSVFLDFDQYKEWHPSWLSIAVVDPAKRPADLQPKDVLKVGLKTYYFNPTVVENTPSCFSWLGNLYGLLLGTHQFHFTPSEQTPGGTTLVHKEDFSGAIAFMFRSGWSAAKSTGGNFEQFNQDLKAAAEKVAH